MQAALAISITAARTRGGRPGGCFVRWDKRKMRAGDGGGVSDWLAQTVADVGMTLRSDAGHARD